MQLFSQDIMVHQLTIHSFQQLDPLTVRRLERLGIRPGSQLTVIRQYPFHGPVILQVDQQQIALRYPVFQALIGGA